jgi:hypothetical protein
MEKVKTPISIDRVESGFEYFIRKEFHLIFPWLGRFQLEDKSPPLFKEQADFPSAVQTRIYRLWKNGKPERCCVKFVYDSRDGKTPYLAEFGKESRDILLAMSNRNTGAQPFISDTETKEVIHTSNF